MAISKRDRFEVFKRDKFTCQYCGKAAPDVVLHIDHIHHLKDLYYIRGILKNRLAGYFNPDKALWLMEAAVKEGAAIDDIKNIALVAANWSEFRQGLEVLYNG